MDPQKEFKLRQMETTINEFEGYKCEIYDLLEKMQESVSTLAELLGE